MNKTEKDTLAVKEYMDRLVHPLKAEINELRTIIMSAHPLLSERIKWNAPSYHINGTDLLTFNHRNEKAVHLIFHHPDIVKVEFALLEGDYKDRRMSYFPSLSEVEEQKSELVRIIRENISIAGL